MSGRKLFFASFLVLVVLVFTSAFLASAQEVTLSSPISAFSIKEIIDALIKFAINIIVPLSAIAVMVAAFLYITAGGSEDKIRQAHRALTYGIVGLFIVLSAKFLEDIVIGVASGATAGSDFAAFLRSVAYSFGTVLMGFSVLAILYSAFLFMTGGGSPSTIEQAKRILTFALVGVAVALLAFAIPAIIGNIVPAS